jgi:hypothetical protein
MWSHRNRIIFENNVVDEGAMVDTIKITSWKWWLGRGKSSPCLYYEWFAESCFALKGDSILFLCFWCWELMFLVFLYLYQQLCSLV